MIVYRVQDMNGRGPWKPGFADRWVEDREDLENLPPWYDEFGALEELNPTPGTWLGSGCVSVHQLQRWFTPKEMKILYDYGHRAVVMEVDRVLGQSEVQVFFERNKPLNVDVMPIKLYA